jgi:hypothetical protein
MFRKIALAGAAAAVIVGAGTTALAVSGNSASTTGHATSSAQHKPGAGHGNRKERRAALRWALRHFAHAEYVTKGSTRNGGAFVKHDAIVGQVLSVSATSIEVKAADGYTKTFVVGSSTHVRKRPANNVHRKPAPATISDVRSGDQVAVRGKGPDSSASPTATVVIDGIKKK